MTPTDKQRLIADRYLLTDLIGRGGMGAVWRATDQLLQRTVAVKELHLGADGHRRALREARTIARVSHPHVVGIYDLVAHEDQVWIVMELVDGPSLADHLTTAGPLPPARTAEIGLQLLDALTAVHAAGALHRDIKPANVLLRADGSVALTDFGIAALSDGESLTGTGEVMGSLDYIAPERLHSRPAGPPSDLFSLGVTLCVLLCGRTPFARPTPAATLHAVAYEQPDTSGCTGPLRTLVEGLVRKDPDERLSAPDAADALREVLTPGPATRTHTLRAPTLPPRRKPRRPRRAAVPLAVLLLASGATTAYLMTGHKTQHAATATPPEPKPMIPDEVMRTPDDRNQYWVFSGDRYALIELADAPRTDKQVTGPRPLTDWKNSLRRPRESTGT
ncbi:serine/threonine protein kinase [Streptomyces albireticuli]|uniref:non-specific serine/threonine protein kinase n=1 Tax=Streptomyces albireticuli TaxID=1940 RepID=A0A1Z2KUP4_9ACTN|nr:serine/threonine-protein kinase [Streptomyces albireticuli]ARZ65740.1 serine/threonine protein kinase [Streptomyces albireticuli]